MKFKWNTEEYVYGLVMGAAFFFALKFWVFLVAPLCGLVWMLGGQYDTNIRRFGVPAVICIALALCTGSWLPLISYPFAMLTLRMGYGIPSFNGPGGTMDDEGSALGKFVYYNIADKNENAADIITRGIIGIAFATSFLPLAWVNIFAYVVGAILIVITYPLIEKYVE